MNKFSTADRNYMKRALELARKGEAYTSPNPMVGAVIVKNGEIIGEGYHKNYGSAHAEVFALQEAGKEANDAVIYLNLEPCSHYGKTPPCVFNIINSGIKKVVIAIKDPNPKVAGKGIEILKKAGVEVEVGLLAEEAKKLNEIFLSFVKDKLPFVFLKKAQTLDGYIAAKNGDSKWITNQKSRVEGHKLRHRVDAIIVGIGTVLADNPALTARLEDQAAKDPVRVVLDPFLKIPLDAKIINQPSTAKTLIIISEACQKQSDHKLLEKIKFLQAKSNLELLTLPVKKDNYFDLKALLKLLDQKNISSVLVEGGGKLSHSFLKNDLIDKFYYFIAAKIYGGSDGIAAFSGRGAELISAAVEIEILEQKILDDDILLIAERKINLD